jgi:hypothetical protein
VVITCADANFTTSFFLDDWSLGYRLANPVNLTNNGVFVGVMGRAEYYIDKKWNQYCASGFSRKNAFVFCRTLLGDGYTYI